MTAARNCGEAGTVHAFEPHEGNYKRLQENLAVNQIRNVRAHRVAASDCAGEAQFFAPTNGNSGLGRLAARPGVLAPEGKVQTVTLDNYLAELGVRSIGFLKIDVEGAEAMVLAGARRYLKEAEGPIIMFEMNPDLSSAFNKTARDIGELLRNCGYKVFEYVHGELVDVDMDHVQGHHDLFALKPAHASRSALFKGLF